MKKRQALIVCLSTIAFSAIALASAKAFVNEQSIKKIKASTYSSLLDSSNAPVLTDGVGTIVDSAGVKWTYSNAATNNSGHVTLNNGGRMQTDILTDWGYSGVESVNAVFNGAGDHLYLQASYDLTKWYDICALESGVNATSAANWSYFRLIADGVINVTSFEIDYSCSQMDPAEDRDFSYGKASSYEYCTIENTTDDLAGNSTRATKISTTSSASDNRPRWVVLLPEPVVASELDGKYLNFSYQVSHGLNAGHSLSLVLRNGANGKTYIAGAPTIAVKDYGTVESGWLNVSVPFSVLIHGITSTEVTSVYMIDYYFYDEGSTGNMYHVLDNMFITDYPYPSLTLLTHGDAINIGGTTQMETTILGNYCSVSYASSNESVATVNGSGLITGVAEGTCTITMSVYLGYDKQLRSVQEEIEVSGNLYDSGDIISNESVTVLASGVSKAESADPTYTKKVTLTYDEAAAEKTILCKIDFGYAFNHKDNLNATIEIIFGYGLTRAYSASELRWTLYESNGTRVSSSQVYPGQVLPSNAVTVVDAENHIYRLSAKVSDFGTSSGAKDSSTMQYIDLLIRNTTTVNDTITFYSASISGATLPE